MNDTTDLLTLTAQKIFTDLVDKTMLDRAEAGEFPQVVWDAIQLNGFDQLSVADSGTDLADLYQVLIVAGRHALPLPLAEACLANRWLGRGGHFCSVGLLSGDDIVDVPWGRNATVCLGVSETGIQKMAEAQITPGSNLGGESRDAAIGGVLSPIATEDNAFALLTLSRVCLMAGALQKVLDLSLAYACEREQFGRTLSKFQVVQHQLAVMAAEVAASVRAADAAIEALAGNRFLTDLAIAKARIGEAVGVVNELAHQIHGAMGYTHEHLLHHFTRRLWAWRDEYGDEVYWQTRLGRLLCEKGGDELWPYLATPV